MLLRAKYFILLFWILACFAFMIKLPNADVGNFIKGTLFSKSSNSVSDFQRLYSSAFLDKGVFNKILIVLNKEQGLDTNDSEYVNKLVAYLSNYEAKIGVKRFVSPCNEGYFKGELVSNDNKVAILILELPDTLTENEMFGSVKILREKINETRLTADKASVVPAVPLGLKVHVTGDAAFGLDQREALTDRVNVVMLLVGVLLIIGLFLTYRSISLAMATILLIGISCGVIKSIFAPGQVQDLPLAWAYMLAMITLLGIWYSCIYVFVLKKRLKESTDFKEALEKAFTENKTRIIFQGFIVAALFSMLYFVDNTLYSAIGVFGALGTIVITLGALTLLPAILGILGGKFFKDYEDTRIVKNTNMNDLIVRRKLVDVAVCLSILSVMAIGFWYLATANDDLIARLPFEADSVQGYTAVNKHFGKNANFPVVIALKSDKNLWKNESLQAVEGIVNDLMKITGIKSVKTATRPFGQKLEESNLQNQMKLFETGLVGIGTGVGGVASDMGNMEDKISEANQKLNAQINMLNSVNKEQESQIQSLDKLQTTVESKENFSERLSQILTNLKQQRMPTLDALGLGTVKDRLKLNRTALGEIKTGVDQITGKIKEINSDAKQLKDVFFLPEGTFQKFPLLKKSISEYISEDSRSLILQVELNDAPFTKNTLATILQIRNSISRSLINTTLENSEFYLGDRSSVISSEKYALKTNIPRLVIIGCLFVFIVFVMYFIKPIIQLFIGRRDEVLNREEACENVSADESDPKEYLTQFIDEGIWREPLLKETTDPEKTESESYEVTTKNISANNILDDGIMDKVYSDTAKDIAIDEKTSFIDRFLSDESSIMDYSSEVERMKKCEYWGECFVGEQAFDKEIINPFEDVIEKVETSKKEKLLHDIEDFEYFEDFENINLNNIDNCENFSDVKLRGKIDFNIIDSELIGLREKEEVRQVTKSYDFMIDDNEDDYVTVENYLGNINDSSLDMRSKSMLLDQREELEAERMTFTTNIDTSDMIDTSENTNTRENISAKENNSKETVDFIEKFDTSKNIVRNENISASIHDESDFYSALREAVKKTNP